MDISLSCGRSDADGNVLDGTAESGHRMPLEVGQYEREVIVWVSLAHIVGFQVFAVFHRQRGFPVRVHDDHRGDVGETVVFGRFQVTFRVGTSAAVGRIAFHDGSVNFLHQIFNQQRIEVIVVPRFARGQFHGYLSGCLAA